MKNIDESKEVQENLVDEELRPEDRIRYHDPRTVKGKNPRGKPSF